MGSSLTLSLANIYMKYWEKDLVEYQQSQNELYFRFIDDSFLTSNDTEEDFKKNLDRYNLNNPAIELTYTISKHVNYLDIDIRNNNGTLETGVYHKPSHELYFLPYSSRHPLHIKQNIPHISFIRAFRYSSSLSIFNEERTHIEISLLLNAYPLEFIKQQYSKILATYNINQID
ncbi:unnamed protein product, partial [Didymodactylos carnosus]